MSNYLEEVDKIVTILKKSNEELAMKQIGNAKLKGGTGGEIFSIICSVLKTYEISNPQLFSLMRTPAEEIYAYAKELGRMKAYNKCLKAEVIISSTGIKVIENNAFGLDPCEYDISKNTRYLKKRIVPDNDYTAKGQGSEMIDSNIVGRKFVKYLDRNYSPSTLQLIDAGCTQSYGDFTMKICVVNKNKIGLFLGEELIILERA